MKIIKMAKIRFLLAAIGIAALAVGAATTYAWYTSVSDPVDLSVDTAKIAIVTEEKEMDITNKLPGEEVELGWTFDNQSSRESVVRFSISALSITNNDYVDLERSELLLELLNKDGNWDILGIASGNNPKYVDANGYIYIWLDEGEQLDNGEFSMKITIPSELGGSTRDLETGALSDPIYEEQNAIITLQCMAYAVQGTKPAVLDIFGTDVADAFDSMYK